MEIVFALPDMLSRIMFVPPPSATLPNLYIRLGHLSGNAHVLQPLSGWRMISISAAGCKTNAYVKMVNKTLKVYVCQTALSPR
jgi:hypothetical protein